MDTLYLIIRFVFGVTAGLCAATVIVHFPTFKTLSRSYKVGVVQLVGVLSAIIMCTANRFCSGEYWTVFAGILTFGIIFPFMFLSKWRWESIVTALATITVVLRFSGTICDMVKSLF